MTDSEIFLTGGARVGFTSASWPFVRLRVKKDKLQLLGTMLGDLNFTKDDVLSIEPIRIIPKLAQGIRIIHNVEDYKKKIIFWTWRNPKTLIAEITNIGFL